MQRRIDEQLSKTVEHAGTQGQVIYRQISELKLNRKLPRQVDSCEVECCPASKRSRYTVGGRLPRALWGRSSL
jgi:hypothetical protein